MMIGGFLRILRGRLYVFFGGSFWIDGGGGARSRPVGGWSIKRTHESGAFVGVC